MTASSAGHYWCEVTFDGAVHQSGIAVVEVRPHLTITTPPVGGDADRRSRYTFTVVVSGGYAPGATVRVTVADGSLQLA